MRQPGAILLLSCYELGRQPLGAAWPAAFLRRAGYRPGVLDLSVEPLDEARVRAARFVGISVPMHTALRLGVAAAARIRALNPGCHVCFFGLYAWLNAEHLLATTADSVIGGEAEEALVELVRRLESGGPVEAEGVSRKGRLKPPILERLDFPPPDRSGLPGIGRYARLDLGGRLIPAGAVEASRGCKHLCRHCPIPPVYGGRFFVVPQDVVLEDVRRLAESGARHITFGDPDFLNGPGHSMAIVRRMRRELPGLTFDFTAKIEHILRHRELFPELASSGCLFVVSAVESLSDRVLERLRKGHTRGHVYEALGILRRAGIPLKPCWVPFTPWTTPEDYLEMLGFVEAEGLVGSVDPVQYSIRLLVPPGSELVNSGVMAPFLGELDRVNFYHRWTHPDPRMDGLHRTVSRLAEAAARTGEGPASAFGRIRAAAHEAFGRPASAPGTLRPEPTAAPRMTEPWFCCAEPTEAQLAAA